MRRNKVATSEASEPKNWTPRSKFSVKKNTLPSALYNAENGPPIRMENNCKYPTNNNTYILLQKIFSACFQVIKCVNA